MADKEFYLGEGASVHTEPPPGVSVVLNPLPPPPVPTVVAREENLLVEPDLTPSEGSTVEPDLLSAQVAPASSGQSALHRLGYGGVDKDPVFGDTTKHGADWIGPVRQPPADARVEVDLEALQTAGFSNFAKSWLDDPTNQEQVSNTPGLNIDIQAMRDAGISDEKIFNTVVKSTPLSGTKLFIRGLEEGLGVGAPTYAGARAGAAAVSALPIPPWWKVPAVVGGAIAGGIAGQEAVNLIAGPNDYDRFAVDGNARSILEAGRTLGMGAPFLRMPFSMKGDVDLGAKAILDSAAVERMRSLRLTGGGLKKLENFLQNWGVRATEAPVLTTVSEAGAVSGSAVGAYLIEGSSPGAAGARLLAEVTGAVLSPAALVLNGGSTVWKGLTRAAESFSPQGRLTSAGRALTERMEQLGMDPEEGLKALQDDQSVLVNWAEELGIDIQDLDLTTRLPSPQAELINKVRNNLARSLGREEVEIATNTVKKDLILMQQVIDKMTTSKDPEVLAAAARLQTAQNESVLGAELQLSLDNAKKAADRLRPEGARLGDEAVQTPDEELATVIGLAGKKARDAGAKGSQVLKEAVKAGRQRWTDKATVFYNEVPQNTPIMPTTVLSVMNDIDASAWPTIPLDAKTRAMLNRIRPGLLDTSPDITATENASAALRLDANTNRQVIKEYDNTVRIAQRGLDRLKASESTIAKDLGLLQDNPSDSYVNARHHINVGLSQSDFRGGRTGIKPPATDRPDPRNPQRKISQDWRASSRDSFDTDATNAANKAGEYLDSALVRKEDETLLAFQRRMIRTRRALDKIADEADTGTGQFSSLGVWRGTPLWNSTQKGVRTAVAKLARKRTELINKTLELSEAQKSFDVPAPNKVLKAQTNLAEQEKQLSINDAYLVELKLPLPGPPEPVMLGEMHNLMRAFGEQSRKIANDPSKNGILFDMGRLSEAAFNDLDATVTAGASDDVTKEAVNALRKANAFWKGGQKVYLKAYGVRDAFELTRYGGPRYPVEAYETRIMSGKPEKTELRLAAMTEAALGVSEDVAASTSVNALDALPVGLTALEQVKLVGTLDAAKTTILRSAATRLIDSDTGLVPPAALKKFRSDYAAELRNFPELEADLQNVKTAQAAMDSVNDKSGIFQTKLDEAATLSEWSEYGTNPSILIQKLIGDPEVGRAGDAKRNFERLLSNARATGDPELLNGIKDAVLNAAWVYGQGEEAGKILSFSRMKSWLTSPMGRNTGDSPLTLLDNANVLTDVERIRLLRFLDDGIKIENIVSEELTKEAFKRGDFKWGGAGKLKDVTDIIDNPGVFAGLTLKVMGSRMGVAMSGAVRKFVPGLGTSGAELIAASAGSRALQQIVQDTPMVAYKNLIFEALSDKDLFQTMMRLGKSSKEKFRIAWGYKSALSSLGIQTAIPETDLMPEEDPSIEERARLRSELYGPGVIRREDVKDPFLQERPVPRATRGVAPPPPTPTVVRPPPPPPQSSLTVSPAPAPVAGAAGTPQRQRFAALYPFDITAGPIRAAATTPQQAAYGGPIKRKRPGILGLA